MMRNQVQDFQSCSSWHPGYLSLGGISLSRTSEVKTKISKKCFFTIVKKIETNHPLKQLSDEPKAWVLKKMEGDVARKQNRWIPLSFM